MTNAAVNNGSGGNARVNLRGLGSNRTLVLVNGRRMIASGTGAASSVDLNTIPVSMIQRVEVLKDGASAVYGTDAIAGVVNVILKRDFEGFEMNVQTGMSGQGDADETSIDLPLVTRLIKATLSLTLSTLSVVKRVRQIVIFQIVQSLKPVMLEIKASIVAVVHMLKVDTFGVIETMES